MLVPIKSLLKKTSRRTNFYMPQKKRETFESKLPVTVLGYSLAEVAFTSVSTI